MDLNVGSIPGAHRHKCLIPLHLGHHAMILACLGNALRLSEKLLCLRSLMRLLDEQQCQEIERLPYGKGLLCFLCVCEEFLKTPASLHPVLVSGIDPSHT